jgi:hypothetical protein
VDVSGSVSLRADGCLPCDVTASVPMTVPMLAVGSPGSLSGDGSALPLRVPGDHERLVGMASDMDATALFPGERIIPVRLDPSRPLPGPAAAWEVLDAVVLDPAPMASIDQPTLLAGGVTLAVTGDVAPDERWQRRGNLWVLSYAPAGPGGVVSEEAYVPTEAWTPGWPVAVREGVAITGVVTCLATVAATSLRRRWPRGSVFVAAAVPLAVAGGVVVWRSTLDPVAYGVGDVTVIGHGWCQRDRWVYERARWDTDVNVPWKGWTHPVFASDEATAGGRMTVGAEGSLAFSLRLSAGATVAFVRRDVTTGDAPAITGGDASAMRGVAPLYLSRGDRTTGETAAPPGRWPGIVIVRP